MIKFWDPIKQYLAHEQEIDEAIKRVLLSGKLVLGASPEIEEFEKNFAKYIGAKHAIMTGGGTHALYLAYRALGIGPGDEVITTSHTFIATIDQIIAIGATPILVDIGEDGLIDPVEVEGAITQRTKAIVPVHLEGKSCKTWELTVLAEKHGIAVIEDACQAIGAIDRATNVHNFLRNETFNPKVGILGKIGCFSFYPAKVLGSLGNAGMCTTDNNELAEKLKMLRCNSNFGKNSNLNAEFGMQLEPDAIQAAVLNVRLKYLDENLARRKAIAEQYDEALKNLPTKLPLKQAERIYQDYVIRIPERKDELVKHLTDNGIQVIGHNLIPNHHYKVLEQYKNKLPKTDEYIAQQIRIPCNEVLTDEEVNRVIAIIRAFYEK